MAKDNKIIRWIHLSDFHVGKDSYGQLELFKEIIQYISSLSKNGFSPDLVFITGDVANKGLCDQYSIFKSEFIAPLIKELPDGFGDRIFVVPGNHDVFRDTHKYFAREDILDQESHFFDTTTEGLNERKQLLPRFENYISSNLPPINWIDSEQGFFTCKLNIKGTVIGIAGINTAWLAKNGDRHFLSSGVNLLKDALGKLDNVQVKIVLGHHPVDWFDDNQIDKIRSVLGRHNALYLHGHLHKNRVGVEDGAGYGFLCVQSGAAFQSRADEKWLNGILLAELYPVEGRLHLQPREWNDPNQEWALSKDLPEKRRLKGSDWWVFPLPKTNLDSGYIDASLRYPTGWQIIDTQFISKQKEDTLDRFHCLRYFDGSEPDWRIASSVLIPKRQIVSKVIKEIQNYGKEGKPQVVLVSGPVGEGKTTAILQTVVELLELRIPMNILWNQGNVSSLKTEDVVNLPQTDIPWLFVSDSADLMAEDIKNVCQILTRHQRSDIRFLICCRDIDWKASKANTWHWAEFANLSDLILSGVGPQDAVNIVNLWLKFGEDAAGSLYGLDSKEAAERLMEAAHSEATKGEGALIGAMLKVRYGKLLREHVKALLGRLEKRKIPGGASLLDAFCYVAAMHSEGLMYLSRPVLAEALGCPLECLNSHVMVPLGMEAATSSDGQFILTRHKSLAELSVELMQEVFQVNFDQIYYDLINAAMSAKSSNFIPLLPQWLYSYADHFDKKGRIDLAIRYGNRVLEMVPNNSSLIVNISRIYRDSGDIFKAVDLFRNYKSNVFEPRGYFVEWGAAEGLYGSYYQSICLLFYSISDQASKSPPTKQAALRFFNILNEYFIEIDKKYIANEFHQARKQSQYFKKILLLARNIERSIEDKEVSDLSFSDSMIETTKQTDISDEFDNLIKNFHFTLLYFDHETDFDFVKGKSPSDLTFICLLRLLKSAIDKNASHSGAAIQECKSE